MPWITDYAPEDPQQIPQQKAIAQLEKFVQDYKKQKKKAVLLHGPPGTGKTSSVHAVAQKLNLELVETNASDTRNADAILSKIGAACTQGSLFGGSKLILIDEVDGVAGRKDRGGVAALIKIIEKSAYPIVMTANDAWNNKLKSLRKKTTMIAFEELSTSAIAAVLQRICEKEGIEAEDLALKGLARRSGGDLRAAINDLEILTIVNKRLTRDSLNELGDRDREESIMNALIKILKTTDPDICLNAFMQVPERIETCLLWLEENIPKEYTKGKDVARAFDALSRADVFFGRIRRWQHWRFLTYVGAHATAGVAVGKDAKYQHFVKYQKPSRILKLWIAKNRFRRRASIAEKLQEHLHTSKKRIVQDVIPFLGVMVRNDTMGSAIAEQYGLDPDDIAWLKKTSALIN